MLVVGGTSFIGRHLLASRSAAGLSTVATCRQLDAAPSIPGVTWVHGDFGAAEPARDWPSRVDTVVVLAQSRQWRHFPDGARDVFAVNVRGAFDTAEYARAAGAQRLIYASSGSVYGTATAPIDISAARPLYVASKLAAETLLSAYQGSFAVVVLRLFMPYGEFQDAGMLLPQIARKVREGESVMLDRDGGLRANPVAAVDVVETIERCTALDHSLTSDVAGPEILTLKDMADVIGRILQREAVFQYRDAPPALIVGGVDPLAAALGWRPSIRPADGFARWLSPARR